MRVLFWITTLVVALPAISESETILLVDGSRIEVSALEVREDVVVFTTADGSRHSVSREFVVTEGNDASIASLIELVGLKELVGELASSAQTAAAGFDDGIVDGDTLALAMREGFAESRLYAVAARAFRESASGMRVDEAIEWLSSPTARTMKRVELAPDRASFHDFLESVTKRPPHIDRVELVMRLDRVTGATAAATEMQMALLGALLTGTDRQEDPDTGRLLDGVRETITTETASRLRLTLLYSYRNVPDDELKRYVSHLESEEGAWVHETLVEALFAALRDGARRAGEIMGERIRRKGKLAA